MGDHQYTAVNGSVCANGIPVPGHIELVTMVLLAGPEYMYGRLPAGTR